MTRRSVSFIDSQLRQAFPNHKYFKPLQDLISDLNKIKEKYELKKWKSEKINEYLFLSWLVKTLSEISIIFLDKINSNKLENATNTVYCMSFLDISFFEPASELAIKKIIDKFYAVLTTNIITIDGKIEKEFVDAADFSSSAHIDINDKVRFKKLFFEWIFQESYPKSGENAHRILINNIIAQSYPTPAEKEKPRGFFSNAVSVSSGFFSQSTSSKAFSNDLPSSSAISAIGDAGSNADFVSLFSDLLVLRGSLFSNATKFQRNLMKNLIEQFWVESQTCAKLDAALASKNSEVPREVVARFIPEGMLNVIITACFFDLQPGSSFLSSFALSQNGTPENPTPSSNVFLEAGARTPRGSFAA